MFPRMGHFFVSRHGPANNGFDVLQRLVVAILRPRNGWLVSVGHLRAGQLESRRISSLAFGSSHFFWAEPCCFWVGLQCRAQSGRASLLALMFQPPCDTREQRVSDKRGNRCRVGRCRRWAEEYPRLNQQHHDAKHPETVVALRH